MLSILSGWRAWATRSLCGAVLMGSMVASYAGASVWQQQAGPIACVLTGDSANEEGEVNPFAAANGTHLIAYVVTASDCTWSTRPDGMEAIRNLRARLQAVHGRSYAQVSVVGVALDTDLEAGLRFLSDLGNGKPAGAFDQVIVGGFWLNEQIVRLVWREGVTKAVSPQIFVIERPVDTASYLSTHSIGVKDDTVVANPIGETRIVTWLREGVPLTKSRTGAPAE